MAVDLNSLIREIYRQSEAKGVLPPFATRVVKLIYLADLEWRRRHGEPLVDVTWRFLHFGPYAYEFASILGDPDMEVAEFEGKTARRFVFSPTELKATQVAPEIQQVLAELVTKWGSTDLNRLLDHVYFDTEPMENAKRGEVLDFSTVKGAEPPVHPQFDVSRLLALRARLREQVRNLGLSREGIHIPAAPFDEQRVWDEESSTPRLPIGLPVVRKLNAE
jgi:hypothetical protein